MPGTLERLYDMLPGGLKTSEGQFATGLVTTVVLRAGSIAETAKDNPTGAILEASLYAVAAAFIVLYARLRTDWKQSVLVSDEGAPAPEATS